MNKLALGRLGYTGLLGSHARKYWCAGGGNGVYNDPPVGVGYDGVAGGWFVRNEDGARMPEGAAFNVAVSRDEPAR